MANFFQGITVQGIYSDVTGNALFGTVGSAAPTEALAMAGSDGTNLRLLSVDATGKVNVNASIAPPSDTIATGTLTNPADTVVVATTGTSALMVNVALSAAITAGNIIFEVSLDGTNYISASLYPVFPDGTPSVATVTTAGQWQIPVGGVQKFRVRASGAFAGGPATITLTAGQGQYSVVALSPIAADFNATIVGNKTNNNAASNGTNVATLPAVATTAAPTYTTGNVVALSTDLAGSLRVSQQGTVTITGTVTANAGTGTFRTAPDGTIWSLTGTSANVDVTNTVTVTGTVAVTQSTSPWIIAGNKTSNNAAPNGTNIGVIPAVANAAAPTYTEGNAVLLSTDLSGNLRTTTSVTGTVAVTQSTSPWTIQGDSASGAAKAGNPVQIGGVFNTTQPTVTTGQTVEAQSTARGALIVATGVDAFTVAVSGTVAVTQSTSPWVVSGTVTANAGTGNFNVVGTLTNNNAAPGANNVGALTALANAANPTYTEGDQVLVSTDLSGHQRTVDAATSATGAAASAKAIQVAGQDSAGNLQALRVSTNRTLTVVPADEALAASLSYFSFDTGATQVSSANPAVTPIISIETNSASVVFLIRGIAVTTNGTLTYVKLIKNGTLTGATFTGTEGNMKTDAVATAVSGGTVVWSGYIGTGVLNPTLLMAAADGTPGDKYTIAVTSLSGTTKVSAAIQWSESAAAL